MCYHRFALEFHKESIVQYAVEYGEGAAYIFSFYFMFDPLAELSNPAGSEDPLAPSGSFSSAPHSSGGARPHGGGHSGHGVQRASDASRYGQELHSVTIRARQRTFYIDLKESGQGKFIKLSEKSRGGQKTTIIFDVEDLSKFVEALKEIQTKL